MNFSKQASHGVVRRLNWWRHQCRMWLLALASLFFLHGSAWAEVAANASFVSGVVTAKASATPIRELAKGHDIFSGDTIDTAENGRIQMRFTDGGLVSLMPRTTFSVDEYLHDGTTADDGSLVFGMLRGGMRTITGSIGKIKHDQYELKTPVATLGIRGTEYVAVLNPPNTLRVHVGKGKVVITNDQGELEVPEGRNAVVTLGSAPEFSEQGPQYLAAGIGGDRASLEGLIDQDPYGVDVTLDTPWAFDEERRLAGAAPSGVTLPPGGGGTPGGGGNPPPPPTPPMINGYGYQIAGFSVDSGLTPVFYELNLPVDTQAQFDQTTGELLAYVGDASLDIGSLRSVNFDSLNQNITWGEFTDGSGTLGGQAVTLSSTEFVPYVVGTAMLNLPATGTLNYNLAGATLAREYGTGVTGTLQSFNLGIDVGNSTYNFDMQVVVSGTWSGLNNPVITASSTAGLGLNGGASGFSFAADTMSIGGVQCSAPCGANVNGFLAGPNAEHAGINYQLSGTNSENMTGAAALNRLP